MATLHTEALVLRAVDFGESDRIVHLLVPDTGRLTAIAKGARRSKRRFAGTLDFFNLLRVHVERRRPTSMARLEQAVLRRPFPELRVDPTRFALGCYLLELLDRLAPEGGARADTRRLFAFAVGALGAIGERGVDPASRTLLELRALEALGLQPELRRCVRCGEDVARGGGGVRFHVADGGAICGACAPGAPEGLPVRLGTLRALDQGLRLDLDRLHRLVLGPEALAEARQLLARFQRFHVGVELKSARFLEERLGPIPGRAS
ncbi:MAG: DNA repair protein RecO [Myxococcota bacterium]|nr:DNA repair protein RecO [Myxococcota bacterium]